MALTIECVPDPTASKLVHGRWREFAPKTIVSKAEKAKGAAFGDPPRITSVDGYTAHEGR